MRSRVRRFTGCSLLDVGCWMFLLLSALPLCAQTATNELPALVPAYGEMPPTFWEQHGALVLVGSLALVALAAWGIWKLLQPKPPVIVPPEVVALKALTKLGAQPEDRRLLGEVSQILRGYIITAFELPAAELTTAEFCAALVDNKIIGGQLAESAAILLRSCDEQKFSSAPTTAPLTAVARALDFILVAETRRAEVGRASPRAESKTNSSSVASPYQPPAK